jgi:hypothetical protein
VFGGRGCVRRCSEKSRLPPGIQPHEMEADGLRLMQFQGTPFVKASGA